MNRQLRRLHQLQGAAKRIDPVHDEGESSDGSGGEMVVSSMYEAGRKKKKKAKPRKQDPPEGEESPAPAQPQQQQQQPEGAGEDEGATTTPSEPSGNKVGAAAGGGKKKKKGGRKGGGVKEAEEEEGDVDLLLAAYRQKADAEAQEKVIAEAPDVAPPAVLTGDELELESVLQTQASLLKPEAELRAIFGAAAVMADRREQPAPGAGVPRGKGKGAVRQAKLRDSILIQPPPGGWWERFCSDDVRVIRNPGTKKWRIQEGTSYARISEAFAGGGGAINEDLRWLQNLLQRAPYHLPSIIALSRAGYAMGQFSEAEELIAKALYAFSLAAEGSGFPLVDSFGAGELICDGLGLVIVEAMRMRAQQHVRRGCFRTGLEWHKMLWSMNRSDPARAFLSLDYIAVKARQFTWFEDLVRVLKKQNRPELRFRALLPNALFGTALCARMEGSPEGEKRAGVLLRDAIELYPSAVPALLREAKGAAAKELLERWQAPEGPEGTERLAELYALRNAELWNGEDIAAWLVDVASRVEAGRSFRPEELRRAAPSDVFVHYAAAQETEVTGRLDVIPEEALRDEGGEGDEDMGGFE
eukprot:Hpha_TRINITY_DN7722_c0_g1::TRINITY_DN7722_c0_g1_i1::g.85494::m.85494